MSETWTQDRVDNLTRLWGEGFSCAQIAGDLGGVSRNAVIGKIHRLGLNEPSFKKQPKPEKKAKAPKQPRDRKRQGNHHAVMKIVAGGHGSTRVIQSSESAQIAKLRCVEIIPLNLTLAELDQATQCHYIPGDDLLYCGHPKREGSAYCAPHHFLCLGDPPKPRRDVIMRRDAA